MAFVNNIFPYFNAPNEGCFFWGYYIECDFQLALFIPLFVYVYHKSAIAGHILVLWGTVADTLGGLYVINKYKMRVGVLAYENWNLFALMLQKPWFHLSSTTQGIYAAWLYI